MAQKAKEEEERLKKEEEEKRIRIERGLETDSDHGDEGTDLHYDNICKCMLINSDEKEKTPEEDTWEPYIPAEPSPILRGFHAKDQGKFWLSMVCAECLCS